MYYKAFESEMGEYTDGTTRYNVVYGNSVIGPRGVDGFKQYDSLDAFLTAKGLTKVAND